MNDFEVADRVRANEMTHKELLEYIADEGIDEHSVREYSLHRQQ